MNKQLQDIQHDAIERSAACDSFEALEALETAVLGRKAGTLTNLMKGMKDLSIEEKKAFGQQANEAKQAILAAFEQARTRLDAEALQALAEQEAIDVTQPPLPKKRRGHVHPMTKGIRQIASVLRDMGFVVEDGPELESDYYNFEVLNLPPNHPARDGHDTFYIKDHPNMLMRTQTSDMQIRLAQKYNAGGTKPVRVACPGRVFRNEALDATHEHTFYQFEGMVIDKEIHIGHLVGTLKEILGRLYDRDDIEVRLRPSYFPFVEPGFELDMKVDLGKGETWVEMLGCGLTHPATVAAAGYDPEQWQAFAFGMGINRMVMAKYGIEDIRHIQSGDLRFVTQF
jgi:phenylalanyl-tRNA synthetase alpha chain